MGWRELEKNAAKELCEVTGNKKLRVKNIIRWSTDYRVRFMPILSLPDYSLAFLPKLKLYIVYKV